jgi:CRP-like cAMP-binding protein
MQRAAGFERHGGATARPLAELLSCPPAVATLLNASARSIEFAAGDTVFRQSNTCRGLYVVISGQLLRRADRMEAKLTLGSVHAGELLELAAALGDGRHTYTLTAQTSGSVMFLPLQVLHRAFDTYPPLRMRLLEELAREVSRVYTTCCATRRLAVRQRGSGSSATPQVGS